MPANSSTRITLEPAFVLHHYDWSESSTIVEAFTRQHGRVALVAKGAKRPASNFRPVLLPLQPLRLTYTGESEVKTLKGAEWVGGYAMPTGHALLTGLYLNELMMRLLPRDEVQTEIYDLYARTVAVVVGATGFPDPALGSAEGIGVGLAGMAAAAVRAFELLTLKHMGWLPDVAVVTQTQQTVDADKTYRISVDAGLEINMPEKAHGISGKHLLELSKLDFSGLTAFISSTPTLANALRHQLRSHLNYHCGHQLKTPQLLSTWQNP